jgi:hypothetical protein
MYSYTQWACNTRSEAFWGCLIKLVSPIIVQITAQSGKRKALEQLNSLPACGVVTTYFSLHPRQVNCQERLRPRCAPIAEAVGIPGTQQHTQPTRSSTTSSKSTFRGRSVLTMTVFSPWRVKLLTLILIWTPISVQGITVTVPLTAPASAPLLSRSLVSFSIEQDRWGDWVGQGAGNPFFFNTLDNLKQLTGEPARIRIGADSEDRTNFNPSVQVRLYFAFGRRK